MYRKQNVPLMGHLLVNQCNVSRLKLYQLHIELLDSLALIFLQFMDHTDRRMF